MFSRDSDEVCVLNVESCTVHVGRAVKWTIILESHKTVFLTYGTLGLTTASPLFGSVGHKSFNYLKLCAFSCPTHFSEGYQWDYQTAT